MILPVAHKGEHRPRLIARLFLQMGKIYGFPVNTRRCASFQTCDPEWHCAQTLCQPIGWGVAGTATGRLLLTYVNFSAQESPGSEDNGGGVKFQAAGRMASNHTPAIDQQIINAGLEYCQIRLLFYCLANECTVQITIALGPSGANCRALARIERAQLDGGSICSPGHHTT